MGKKGILERLQNGEVIVGDGGFVMALEKRGYVSAGPWTPEAVIEHPEAVRQLHREFLRAGSDVMQTFTFYASDDKLKLKGHEAGQEYNCQEINNAACKIAHEIANEGDALVAGSISACPSYKQQKGKEAVQASYRAQIQRFLENKVDFIILEFFMHIVDMEWAIEEVKKSGLPVAATMSISKRGDHKGISAGECAVRMAKAGAEIVGLQCLFDPIFAIDTIKEMKSALDAEGLKPYLMTQPNGFCCPEVGKEGYLACSEFPFAMEPRVVTRFDVYKYAREAYDLGVRYIGGCCGFEAYHIRSISEALSKERGGKLPPASKKYIEWGGYNAFSIYPYVAERHGQDYWENLVPSSGRLKPPTHGVNPKPE